MPGFHDTAKGPYVKLSNGGQSAARLQETFSIFINLSKNGSKI